MLLIHSSSHDTKNFYHKLIFYFSKRLDFFIVRVLSVWKGLILFHPGSFIFLRSILRFCWLLHRLFFILSYLIRSFWFTVCILLEFRSIFLGFFRLFLIVCRLSFFSIRLWEYSPALQTLKMKKFILHEPDIEKHKHTT